MPQKGEKGETGSTELKIPVDRVVGAAKNTLSLDYLSSKLWALYHGVCTECNHRCKRSIFTLWLDT